MKVQYLSAGMQYDGVETILVTLSRLRYLTPEIEPMSGLCLHGQMWDERTAYSATLAAARRDPAPESECHP